MVIKLGHAATVQPDAKRAQMPKKHFTCFFWADPNLKCKKSDEECRYYHELRDDMEIARRPGENRWESSSGTSIADPGPIQFENTSRTSTLHLSASQQHHNHPRRLSRRKSSTIDPLSEETQPDSTMLPLTSVDRVSEETQPESNVLLLTSLDRFVLSGDARITFG
ncbi:hypothetical protein K402DRAFT_223939 [Aulographum hederae CBS 113979]|uniref:C3H1-type domain-containing protein n=1 Tax=Aulographum hederae CBS 113979 TaxID=1176131 RepID=A0A6G1HAF0_9PEZI|nr:hypothetical protein K402DRAFT_223939 [Aulographum hederae CBS 113979]